MIAFYELGNNTQLIKRIFSYAVDHAYKIESIKTLLNSNIDNTPSTIKELIKKANKDNYNVLIKHETRYELAYRHCTKYEYIHIYLSIKEGDKMIDKYNIKEK